MRKKMEIIIEGKQLELLFDVWNALNCGGCDALSFPIQVYIDGSCALESKKFKKICKDLIKYKGLPVPK